MAAFDAIFFDIDGTLLVNSSLMPKSMQKAFADHGFHVEIEPWRGSGRTDNEIICMFLDDFPLDPAQKAELRPVIADELTKNVLARVKECGTEALPGTVDVIRRMRERGLYPGLLTGNKQAIVGAKLESAGFDRNDFFYGGFGDTSKCRAETAQQALDSASAFFGRKIDPDKALVIGDTPNDVACARAVGAHVLAVASGHLSMDELRACAPDHLLPDFRDPSVFFEILENPHKQ